jgi:hypothetical protein
MIISGSTNEILEEGLFEHSLDEPQRKITIEDFNENLLII